MSIFNDKVLKSVAEAAAKVMQQEELKGDQHKIDANKNGKVDAHDFKLLRGKKNLKEDDTGYQDRYAVKNGKAVKHNPMRGERDEPHHVWADSAEHAVRKHAAKTAKPVKEDVQQLDEIGDTPAGQKLLKKVDSRAFYKGGTKSGGKGNMADAGEKTLQRTQARIKKTPGLVSRAVGAVKKALTREEIERLDELDAAAIAAYKASPASNKKSSVPHRAGPGPSKFKQKMAAVSRTAEKGHDYFGHDAKRQQSGYRGPGQSVMQTAADKVKKGIGAIKKVFSREEVEAIFNDFTLDEIQTFMMSEEFANLHVESQEQIDSYLEDRLLDEGFPSVEDAKKRMAAKESPFEKKKISTGTVYSRKAEPEKEEAPKKKKMSEMIELYNEHGIRVLDQIVTKRETIGDLEVEVMNADDISGPVDTIVEEPTNDEFTKELKDQQATAAGKKPQPKISAGKTVGVKTMPEEVELEERELSKDEAKKKEEYVKGMKKGLSGFKARYGERAKEVMYATATKMAKKD